MTVLQQRTAGFRIESRRIGQRHQKCVAVQSIWAGQVIFHSHRQMPPQGLGTDPEAQRQVNAPRAVRHTGKLEHKGVPAVPSILPYRQIRMIHPPMVTSRAHDQQAQERPQFTPAAAHQQKIWVCGAFPACCGCRSFEPSACQQPWAPERIPVCLAPVCRRRPLHLPFSSSFTSFYQSGLHPPEWPGR